jgi:ECF sigma factor
MKIEARRSLWVHRQHWTSSRYEPSWIEGQFLKLIHIEDPDWKSRKHFYRAVSQIMRRVLVDYAPKKRFVKRGLEGKRVPFDEAMPSCSNNLPF